MLGGYAKYAKERKIGMPNQNPRSKTKCIPSQLHYFPKHTHACAHIHTSTGTDRLTRWGVVGRLRRGVEV